MRILIDKFIGKPAAPIVISKRYARLSNNLETA
jgi:hypothetical protein